MELYLTSEVVGLDFDFESKLTVAEICRLCSHYFKVPEHEVMGENRQDSVKKARHFTCYFGMLKRFSSTEIGDFLNKNHSSVLYGRDMIQHKLGLYSDIDKAYRWINSRLN